MLKKNVKTTENETLTKNVAVEVELKVELFFKLETWI